MSNYEIKINAINMRDVKISLKEWCEALGVMPDVDPEHVLQMIDLDTIRAHLEARMADMGMTLDIKAMVDEIVEVKAPKRARKEKAPVQEESVSLLDEPDAATLEAIKADVIRKCQALYVKKGGKEIVDDIIARHGDGETKLSLMPAALFPAISEELQE